MSPPSSTSSSIVCSIEAFSWSPSGLIPPLPSRTRSERASARSSSEDCSPTRGFPRHTVTSLRRSCPALAAAPPLPVWTVSVPLPGPNSCVPLSSISVLVDGLCVEPALDAAREGSGSVRVQRDVGDRARLAAADERAVVPLQALRVGLERRAGQQARLGADLLGGAADRRGRAGRRGGVEAVARAEAVLVGRHDLDVERRNAQLLGHELRVLRLVAVGLGG